MTALIEPGRLRKVAARKRQKPTDPLAALRNLYNACWDGDHAKDRTVRAIATVADALEHAVEHGHLKELEKLARVAKRYAEDHECYAVTVTGRDGPKVTRKPAPMVRAPLVTRLYVLRKLVWSCSVLSTRGREEIAYFAPLILWAHGGDVGLPPPPGDANVTRELLSRHIAKALKKDKPSAEDLSVAILVGWGIERSRARRMIQDAMRRKND